MKTQRWSIIGPIFVKLNSQKTSPCSLSKGVFAKCMMELAAWEKYGINRRSKREAKTNTPKTMSCYTCWCPLSWMPPTPAPRWASDSSSLKKPISPRVPAVSKKLIEALYKVKRNLIQIMARGFQNLDSTFFPYVFSMNSGPWTASGISKKKTRIF